MKSLLARLYPLFSNIPLLCCFLIGAGYLLPLVVFPGFSVIDDGWTLHITDTLTETPISDWSGVIVETAIGRLRPLYYLYFYVLYVLAGPRPFLFWLIQGGVLIATLIVAYQILFRITKRPLVSLLGLLSAFLFPALPENLYRLGTQEPRQFLFQLLFIWWAMNVDDKKLTLLKAGVGCLWLILALGTKETSLILIPVFLTIYTLKLFQGKWRSVSHLALTIFITLIGVGFYLLIPEATNYSLGYDLTPGILVLHAFQIRLSHLPIFWLLGIASCFAAVRLYFFAPSLNLKKIVTIHFGQIVIFLSLIASILIILPWSLHLVRYYYNITFLMIMFVTIEVAYWWALWPKLKKMPDLQKVIVGATLLLLCVGMNRIIFQLQVPNYGKMVTETISSMKIGFSATQNNHAVAQYLMDNTPNEGNFYAAFADYEVVYDMGQYASMFGDRSIVIYNANEKMSTDFGYPYVYVEDPYQAYLADPGPKILADKANEPKLQTLNTPVTTLMPKVTFYNAQKDLWAGSKSP